MAASYEIPKGCDGQVRPIQPKDDRTDAQILDSLANFSPINPSEKNIWAFWDQGLYAMPSWNKRNVVQWVRMHGSDWTVRILDNVPDSPNYALNYLPAEYLPGTFTEGTMDGPYVGPHSADLLRGACLYLYGGVFMDVGIILIRHLDRICWNQLADPESPFQVSIPLMYSNITANHWTGARKGDPFIKRWHDLFVHLWQGRTNHRGMVQTPLLAFLHNHDFSGSRAAKFDWKWAVEPLEVFDYVSQVAVFARLTMLEEAGDGFSCADYWTNNILLFDSLEEDWAAEAILSFDGSGEKLFELLALPLDSESSSEQYQQAEKLVWRLLTQSSMQKVVHGKGLYKDPSLGKIWDEPENDGKDAKEGTFAGLLRWGCVNLEQTRENIRYVDAPEPPAKMKKGVFEE